jgi:hypothetical protein
LGQESSAPRVLHQHLVQTSKVLAAITPALRQMKSRMSSGVVEALVDDAGEADAIHIHWYDSDADTCGDQADDG